MDIEFYTVIDALKHSDLKYLQHIGLNEVALEKDNIVGERWIRHVIDVANVDVVEWVLKDLCCDELNITFEDGHNLVTACLEREDDAKKRVLSSLIDHKINIDLPGWQGMPPLIYSLFLKDYDSTKQLLEGGADVNVRAELDGCLSFLEIIKTLDCEIINYLGLIEA